MNKNNTFLSSCYDIWSYKHNQYNINTRYTTGSRITLYCGIEPIRSQKFRPYCNFAVLRALTPWGVISRIFGTGSPTNLKLSMRMKYDDSHHRNDEVNVTTQAESSASLVNQQFQGADGAYCCAHTSQHSLFCARVIVFSLDCSG